MTPLDALKDLSARNKALEAENARLRGLLAAALRRELLTNATTAATAAYTTPRYTKGN
jgi:hypothetical protein